MNQGQLTPSRSTGLKTPIRLKVMPVQSKGMSRPPQAIGRGTDGSVGSNTP